MPAWGWRCSCSWRSIADFQYPQRVVIRDCQRSASPGRSILANPKEVNRFYAESGLKGPMIPSFAQPSSIGQRYTVIQRLGGGAMGAVFLAMDEVRHERVAIKVPAASRHWRAEYERRVVKEIGILSALQHPNIIEIHDWGQDPQLGPYIVMEYIEGGSVRQMMARYPGERLPPLEAMRIV